MGLYDVAKDAVKLAQKLDNLELVQKLLDVQSMALEMQEKQHTLNGRVEDLMKENASLKTVTSLSFEPGHSWYLDEENLAMKFCPVCANRDSFKNPLDSDNFCYVCKREYE